MATGPRSLGCPRRFGKMHGYPVLPTSHRQWYWWGEVGLRDDEGFPIRAGRDRKIAGSGFDEISRCGPFKIFTFQHEIPDTGPSQLDLDATVRWPGRYEIIYDTHYIQDKEVYLYGDERDAGGRDGLVLISGRDFTGARSPARSRSPVRGPHSKHVLMVTRLDGTKMKKSFQYLPDHTTVQDLLKALTRDWPAHVGL